MKTETDTRLERAQEEATRTAIALNRAKRDYDKATTELLRARKAAKARRPNDQALRPRTPGLPSAPDVTE